MTECIYCEAEMDDPVKHHSEEHPRKRFDPTWYWSDPTED